MRRSLRTNLIRCLSAASVGSMVTWFYINSRWTEELAQVDQYRVLCDAFSIPGILMVLFGMLFSLNNLGALDTIAYLMSFLPRMIAPGAFGEPEKFYDYVEGRRTKRTKGYGFLYIVGFSFLAVAMVFMYLFYSVF